jgi:heptosyltransferase-2
MRKRSAAGIRRLISGPAARSGSGFPHPATAHHVHQYLHLTAALGANPEPIDPQLAVTAEECETAAKKFGLPEAGVGLRPLLGLNAGAEYGPAKRWPDYNFAQAAIEIQKRTHCHWLIFGGANTFKPMGLITEEVTRAALGRAPGKDFVFNLAGRTSLRELMALLKLCRVLLTNDTGPMHVAAALGTPVVVPFGSTSPELTGPGLPGDSRHRLLQSDVPCAPCFRRECPIDFRCMNGISVERVVEAVVGALKG